MVKPKSRPIVAIVLAAGEGSRMNSSLPKPLHEICGKAMVLHVLDSLVQIPLSKVIVVVGHGAEEVTKLVQAKANARLPIEFVEQPTQRGTGDAVAVGLTAIVDVEDFDENSSPDILVLPGDAPLITSETIAEMIRVHWENGKYCTMLTAELEDPTGYGRILRDKHGNVIGIVEQTEAEQNELAIKEVCTSFYCFRYHVLGPALRRLVPENFHKEYYLTDVISVLASAGYGIQTFKTNRPLETSGVNDLSQLAEAERVMRNRINLKWMKAGVKIIDPSTCYIGIDAVIEQGVEIRPCVIINGASVIKQYARLGPHCEVIESVVGERAIVEQSVLKFSEIGREARIGPFAYMEPGSRAPENFVSGPYFRGLDEELS